MGNGLLLGYSYLTYFIYCYIFIIYIGLGVRGIEDVVGGDELVGPSVIFRDILLLNIFFCSDVSAYIYWIVC